MNPIDIRISSLPFLLNDFLHHAHEAGTLRVFLCGSQTKDAPFDLRRQIQRLIERKMGCTAFLGEDIDEINLSSNPARDHLTIEVSEAKKSDIIIIFLESPGTISELTAFALDKAINGKLIVFNDEAYKEARSFLNLGPLKLIDEDRIIYYNPKEPHLFAAAVAEIDRVIAREWFKKSPFSRMQANPLSFEGFVALVILYASYPIRYNSLVKYFGRPHRTLDKALGELFDKKLIVKLENKYLPTLRLEELSLTSKAVKDVAGVRTMLLNRRLKDPELVADYRLLI